MDVREKTEYNVCHLEDSLNIPFSKLFSHDDGEETVNGKPTIQQLIYGDRERYDEHL